MFSLGKMEFEHIMNSVYTAQFLALGNAQNKNVDYLIYYSSRQHVN